MTLGIESTERGRHHTLRATEHYIGQEMQNLFAPGRFIMNRLSYFAKFVLVGVVILIPAALFLSRYLNRSANDLHIAQTEQESLSYTAPVIQLIKDLQRHRGLTTSAMQGYGGFQERIRAAEMSIQADLQALDTVDTNLAAKYDLAGQWSALKQEWLTLDQNYQMLTPRDSFNAHTEYISKVHDFLVRVANNSGLILDSQLDTYYLIDLTSVDLPELYEDLAQIRGYGTFLVTLKNPTADDLRFLSNLHDSAVTSVETYKESFAYAFSRNSDLQAALKPHTDAFFAAATTFLDGIKANFFGANGPAGAAQYVSRSDASVFFDRGTDIVDSLGRVYTDSLNELNVLLQERVNVIVRERTLFLTIMLIAFAVALYLLIAFYQTVRRTIGKLEEAAQRLSAGEAASGVVLEGRDELAQVAVSFNTVGGALIKANQDLTKRGRELEIANAMAREANRVKSQFLSTMSHELRTPMNAIIGFTDLLLTAKPGPLTPMQKMFLERAAGNNRRLLALINDILDLSRIEAGRMEIHPKPYSVREMLDQVTAQTSSLFSQKGLRFESHIASDVPDQIVGDRGRVEQVIINLLSNAAKFTAVGSVELSLARVNADQWSIAVQDTGKGIAPHMQEIIFEPFRQADGGTTRESSGSGLGLAISRELVNMMDGTVSVKSAIGQGTTFTVTLPIKMLNPVEVELNREKSGAINKSVSTPFRLAESAHESTAAR